MEQFSAAHCLGATFNPELVESLFTMTALKRACAALTMR